VVGKDEWIEELEVPKCEPEGVAEEVAEEVRVEVLLAGRDAITEDDLVRTGRRHETDEELAGLDELAMNMELLEASLAADEEMPGLDEAGVATDVTAKEEASVMTAEDEGTEDDEASITADDETAEGVTVVDDVGVGVGVEVVEVRVAVEHTSEGPVKVIS
jgi:hypothetical protein